MLDTLRQFVANVVPPGASEVRAFGDTDYRLAATALLVHVISLGGEPSDIEKRKLHSLLESRFKLDPGTADQAAAPGATRTSSIPAREQPGRPDFQPN